MRPIRRQSLLSPRHRSGLQRARLVFGRFLQTASVRGGQRRADILQPFCIGDAPATGKFIQLADSKNRFTERLTRAFESRIESALLRQTRRRLSLAHFPLLIRIDLF